MEDTILTSDILSLVLGGPILTKYSVSCESNNDEEVLRRIIKHNDLALKILVGLRDAADWKDDNRYSAKACGQKAYSILKSLCEDMLYWLDEEDVVEICRTYIRIYEDSVKF